MLSRTPDARTLALKALDAVERRNAFSDAILAGLLDRYTTVPPRDRALVSHLVYGVLRWRNRLDEHIARASTRPLAKIHPRLLNILRLGVYQILFLDRLPERAAVNETVELTRRFGLGHASGFANAVLRKVVTEGPDLPLPDDPVPRLSLLFGCPQWLVEIWREEYGPEGAEALCQAASRIPTLWLRVVPERIHRDGALEELRRAGLEAEAGGYAPEAIRVGPAGDPRSIPLISSGQAVVQDQASQLVAHVVAPRPGWTILDACAAPGLKATHLASLAGSPRDVTAIDVHPHRVRMVEALSRRLGQEGLRIQTADARTFRAAEPFDAVLVDAPCSGLGVLDRNPEAKWRRPRTDIADVSQLQLRILENLADAVRPGGVLVYATCTTTRAENEGVVEEFLAGRDDFAIEPLPEGLVDWHRLVTEKGFLRTFPGPSAQGGPRALDGFFAARLRRQGGPG